MSESGRSQFNEDEIIQSIFEVLCITIGTYFEIGVNDRSKHGSIQCNTVALKNKGWNGTWIDANCEHPSIINSFITPENINDILARYGHEETDFLSIDIDSHDWHVVRKILEKGTFSIKVFCVETNNYNGYCFLDRVLRPDAPAANTNGLPKCDAFGATTYSYCLLMKRYGYQLVATSAHGVNAFFVKDEFASRFPSAGHMEELYVSSNNLGTNWGQKGPAELMTTAASLLQLE